jgi:hypothetical protein
MRQIDRETYTALRLGGASPMRTCAELGLGPVSGRVLEAAFRQPRPGKGGSGGRPRFARHEAHVSRVLAEGGFSALRP